MLMERMFNSHHLKLVKSEKIMNKSYNNQIYMHFFMFANAESLVSLKKNIEATFMEDDDGEKNILQYYIFVIYIKSLKIQGILNIWRKNLHQQML